ncbi:YjjG family noncanonical pyrimidine nucleotidase [Arcicella rigui]|uniref:YjjG family noncanonical pyrimidine nucleotidase n=1 Tax=Arcicella rigui TaxID=797020 RepID=A0ABU5Q4N3_9BACT|nr:YjjG family noncanonical pyrimidine nucleotidase [Arcicella rigui]MEA5137578.1 YjjG family noncanonical pyrimidine nucleotidase [Arcicella rigui]
MYKHLFFDLDHTLWDHNTNSKLALDEVYQHYHLQELGISSSAQFYLTFNEVNHQLWDLYEQGKISQSVLRHERFRMIFSRLGCHDHSLCDEITERYIHTSVRKPHLLPNTTKVLDYLFPKYPLHIITNGFIEIQEVKMSFGGIKHYFREIITSQNSGYKKPDVGIFEYALDLVGAKASECIMIGDSFQSDIVGANKAGIDTVFFNPDGRKQERTFVPKHEVKDLIELKRIL